MIEIIKEIIEKKEIASIYTDVDETDSFAAGFIQDINDQNILIAHVSQHGIYDGYIVLKTDAIYRIDRNGQYEQKLSKLYMQRKQSHEAIDIKNNDIVFSVLEHAIKTGAFVNIELLDKECSAIQGLILKNGDTIVIEQYDDFGNSNGETILNKNDIIEIGCDTDDVILMMRSL